MDDSKHILIPAKFLGLILHFVAASMLYFSYNDNIIASYPALATFADTLYVGGRASFLAANTLTIIGLSIELLILFIGVNMFKQRLSFIIATVHFFGCILYTSYGFWQWQFTSIWALWAVFSFFPLTVEIIAACHPSNR